MGGVQAAPADLKVESGIALTRGTLAVEAAIKRDTPRVTGNLFGHWTHSVGVEEGVGIVGNNLLYAPFVEFGTGPHDIRPKKAKALYFNGRFAKVVHHPGTKGQHPAERGLKAATPQVLAEFMAAAQRLLAKMAGK